MLPETIWRPSRLTARLTTPLVCPRSVKTSSCVTLSQSLIVRSSLAVASRRPLGKIGDGGDQAGVPGQAGGLVAGQRIPELDLGGSAAHDSRRRRMRSCGRRVRTPGRARRGSVPRSWRAPRRSPHPRLWLCGLRRRRRPGGRRARRRRCCCLLVARDRPDGRPVGNIPEPDGSVIRTPWPRACPSGEKAASLTGAGCPRAPGARPRWRCPTG